MCTLQKDSSSTQEISLPCTRRREIRQIRIALDFDCGLVDGRLEEGAQGIGHHKGDEHGQEGTELTSRLTDNHSNRQGMGDCPGVGSRPHDGIQPGIDMWPVDSTESLGPPHGQEFSTDTAEACADDEGRYEDTTWIVESDIESHQSELELEIRGGRIMNLHRQ